MILENGRLQQDCPSLLYQSLQLKYIHLMKKIFKQGEYIKSSHKFQQRCNKLSQGLYKNKPSPIQPSKQFMKIIEEVIETPFFHGLVRHAKIKLESWLQALSKPQFNLTWRSNKLNYLKLLNLMCQCEYLIHPFTSFPDQSFLPILQKHQINHIIDQVEKQVKQARYSTKKSTNKTSIKNKKTQKILQQKFKHDLDRNLKKLSRTKTTLTIQEKFIDNKAVCDMKNAQNQGNYENWNPSISLDRAYSRKPVLQQLNNLHSNHARRSLNTSKKLSNKSLLKQSVHHSIFDSIDLFNPVSVSSRVWRFTHQSKNIRSKTMDIRKSYKDQGQNSERSYQAIKNNSNEVNLEINNTENIQTIRKEYWESQTLTVNATPKYLNNIRNANILAMQEESEIVTYRSQDKNGCNCTNIFWNYE